MPRPGPLAAPRRRATSRPIWLAPEHRSSLRSQGPVLALLTALVALAPVLIWNMRTAGHGPAWPAGRGGASRSGISRVLGSQICSPVIARSSPGASGSAYEASCAAAKRCRFLSLRGARAGTSRIGLRASQANWAAAASCPHRRRPPSASGRAGGGLAADPALIIAGVVPWLLRDRRHRGLDLPGARSAGSAAAGGSGRAVG
jgi:hypothetical protein